METWLYDAAAKGDVESLVNLLKEDPLILDRVSFTCSKKTPLHIATICQRTAFVRKIVQTNPLLAAELDSHQSSSLHIASAKGYTEIVRELVSAAPDMCLARDCQGRNPLHLAAINGYTEIVRELVSAEPDMCLARDCRGRNPLHLAAINGHVTVFDVLMETTTSSVAVREKVDRGQTVLHLCVKHKQLLVMENITQVIKDYEFVNAKNDDGDTILHLAVRDKNLAAVRHLTESTGIDEIAKNANGYSALDILKLTPTNSRNNNNYFSIKDCLQSEAYNSINRPKQKIKWIKRNSIMVVAILIATMSFQAGMTPPGGVWQENANDNSHQAGEAVMAHFRPKIYRFFIIANTISFTSSLSMIMILIIGFPLGKRYVTFSLMAFMWLSIVSTGFVYGASIREVTPRKDMKTMRHFMDGWAAVWYSLTVIPLVGNMVIRLVNRRPRRFIDSVNVNQDS